MPGGSPCRDNWIMPVATYRRFGTISAGLTTFFIVFILAGCGGPATDRSAIDTAPPSSNEQLDSPEVDSHFAGTIPAPPFPAGLEWLNSDGPLSWEQLRGKIVVVDFWTYGCINCLHSLPFLDDLKQEFAEELVVIGVHSAKFTTEGNLENIRQVSLRYGVDHPIVNDQRFDVWRAWGVSAWPTLFIVDPVGNVSVFHRGEGFYEGFRQVIATLIHAFEEEIDRRPLQFEERGADPPQTLLSFPSKVLVDPAMAT